MTPSTFYVCRLSRRLRNVLGKATEINLNDIETPLYLLSYTAETRVGGAVLETCHECLPLPKDLNLAHGSLNMPVATTPPFLPIKNAKETQSGSNNLVFLKLFWSSCGIEPRSFLAARSLLAALSQASSTRRSGDLTKQRSRIFKMVSEPEKEMVLPGYLCRDFNPLHARCHVSAKRCGSKLLLYSLNYSVHVRTDGSLETISGTSAAFTTPETDQQDFATSRPSDSRARTAKQIESFGKKFLALSLSRVVRTAINVNELASPQGYLGDRAASCAGFRRVRGMFPSSHLSSIAAACIFRSQ